MAIQKGSGFTNLNKIMQANKGNKLGQTVSGGITGQVQGVKTGVKSAQEQFQEEAQKNRLDTPEAAAKRGSVLGRFDESNYKSTQELAAEDAKKALPQSGAAGVAQPTPARVGAFDESKFSLSKGLTDQYGQNKTALQQQQAEQQAKAAKERAIIQARIDQDTKVKADAQALVKKFQDPNSARNKAINAASDASYSAHDPSSPEYQQFLHTNVKLRGGQYDSSLNSLTNLLGTYNQTAGAQEKALTDKLSNLESQYGKMSADEKAQWMQSERDRLMAANQPTEQELAEFTKYRTGTYTGPKELQDSASLYGKAAGVESLGGLSRSAGGREELLRRFVGGDNYTQGQRTLDSAILGQEPGALGAAARETRGASNIVDKANTAASGLAQEYVGKAAEFGKETREKIQGMRDPLSTRIDEQVKGLTEKEKARTSQFKQIQDMLSGADPRYADLDKNTRTGLALQQAMDSGAITPQEAEQLVGQGGLISRAGQLGLDTNALLAERMKDTIASGIDRKAGATSDQEARMTALDKLMGRAGTDIEFGARPEQYTAGKTGFDLSSLEDYISKTEGERGKASPATRSTAMSGSASPLQQIIGGAGGILDAGSQAGGVAGVGTGLGLYGLSAAGAGAGAGAGMAGGAMMAPAAGAVMLGTDLATGGDSSARAAEGAVQMGSGSAGLGLQGRNAVLNALMKAAPGTPASQQIGKILAGYQDLEQRGLGELTKEGMNVAGGLRDLTQTGKLDQAWSKLSGYDTAKNIAGNVGKAASTALRGGQTGNWATEEYGTVDDAGQWHRVGSFADKSSDEIMKQMLSKWTIDRTGSSYKDRGAGIMDTLLNYYQQAQARENSGVRLSDKNLKTKIDYNSKDVQGFMDRIKPAAYDYKDEVKDSPLASKNRELGVMAQDLEKSKLGKEAVTDTSAGKVVDYDNLGPKMLASIAALNERLKNIEKK